MYFMGKTTFWVIVVVVLCIVAFFISKCNAQSADLPEYADLMFTDQADLDRQVDSVLGICDTARVDSSAALCAYGDTTIWFTYPRLLCRWWAGLTVFWMPDEPRPGIWTDMPSKGKARLWWWEVTK